MWINSLVWSLITIGSREAGERIIEGDPMVDHDVMGRAEFDEEIPTFDVPDDALERAANAESQATTWVYCTHPWYYCPWPQ
jgi:hypothetical protein